MSFAIRAAAAGLLLLALTACGGAGAANLPTGAPGGPAATEQPAATTAPSATTAPAATAAPTTAPAATAVPTGAPAATAAPTRVPNPAQWTDYREALGRWSISYPASLLSPVGMSDGLMVFISKDRGFFVAVDSCETATADPDGLRSRAKAALTQIYGSRPATIDAVEQTDAPWQVGVRFATAKGSEGTAVYRVAGPAGHQWTYGLIYGYKTQGSQQLRETLYQTIAKLQLNPPSAASANDAEGLPANVQQPILDAAWAKLKPQYPKDALLIGLIGTEGEYAAALATPAGQRPLFVYLQRHAGTWAVVEASSILSSEILRQIDIPESLIQASDAYFVVDLTSGRVQDPRGGLNGYISAPRIADGFARLFVIPAESEQRDAVTMLFKREGTTWTWLSAGTAFPEDDLAKLGVPESLWPYGESVQGPA